MTLPRSAADVLAGHVTFEVECIDRMYLNVYVPQLQYATGLVSYIHRHLGKPVASPAALAPATAKLCLNGNEWAKRQAAKAGIGFTPLDNAFAAIDDVPAVQAICHALGPAQIDALLRKWLARLPHPFGPADRAAGYRYDISI